MVYHTHCLAALIRQLCTCLVRGGTWQGDPRRNGTRNCGFWGHRCTNWGMRVCHLSWNKATTPPLPSHQTRPTQPSPTPPPNPHPALPLLVALCLKGVELPLLCCKTHTPSQHDCASPELMKTQLMGTINLTFATWCVTSEKFLKLVCLTSAWLGPNQNTAFGTKKSYLRSMMCQVSTRKKQLKLVCLALVWLGTNENSAFGDQLPCLHNMMCQPWKTLKLQRGLELMKTSVYWLGTWNWWKHGLWDH